MIVPLEPHGPCHRPDCLFCVTSLEWTEEGHILNCPWHGWEYDVTTGECLSRNRVRLPAHDVEVRDGEIVVSL